MADLKKTIEILFEGNDQASRKASDVIAKLNEMERQGKATATSGDDVAKSLDNIGRKDAVIAGAAAALKAFAAALVIDRFIEANSAVERFENGLRAVGGTAAGSAAELEFVRNTANRLGIDVQSTANAYLNLIAATKGTTLEGRATREVFEAVAQAMGSLGKSSAETEGAFLAITQIVSKGKVTMEELSGQLGERLPGAMQIAARAMGVTTAELAKMVEGGLSATEFLPKFAGELNRTFAGASFDGYQSQLNRLRNSLDELLVQAGKAGAFEALTTGVEFSTRLVRILGVEFADICQRYEVVARAIRTGDFSTLAEDFTTAGQKAEQLRAELDFGLNQSLAETQRLARQAADAATDSFDQSAAETARLTRQMNLAAEATTEVDKLFKKLGVDPKKTTDGIEEIVKALEALANNPRVNGEDFALGFAAALKKAASIDAVTKLGEVLARAFNDGKISSDAYQNSLKSLSEAFDRVTGSGKKAKEASDEQAKAVAKQAEEMRKAEVEAQKMRLELEKIASNERIKNIEAKVKLNVAEIEAQTKRVEAAFESINTTVNSTGDLIGDLFSLLKDYDNLNFGAIRLIEKQIETENARRQEALNLQKQLIEAQVAQLRAQTRAVERGDSIIKVDGAGLQPHLEAFMWEILRTIQVRVNADGLKLLLGV